MDLGGFDKTLTHGEGAVALFPRGAVNHPSLLVSACVLFDSLTLLRPVDIEGTCMHRAKWRYRLRPNHEADGFWRVAHPLVERGALKLFRTKADLSSIDGLHDHPDNTTFGVDAFDGERDGTGETRYFAAGFTEYFQYIGANCLPLVISKPELHDVPFRHRSYPVLKLSQLSGDSVRILNSCLPQIETADHPPAMLALNIADIRENLQHERSSFISLVGRLSVSLTGPIDADECAAMIDKISSDSIEIWEAYKSKLTELANKSSMLVRFVPLLNSLLNLDQIACGEHLAGVRREALPQTQLKQMMAFIWQVDQVANFWR